MTSPCTARAPLKLPMFSSAPKAVDEPRRRCSDAAPRRDLERPGEVRRPGSGRGRVPGAGTRPRRVGRAGVDHRLLPARGLLRPPPGLPHAVTLRADGLLGVLGGDPPGLDD